jgi:hypothetical protein
MAPGQREISEREKLGRVVLPRIARIRQRYLQLGKNARGAVFRRKDRRRIERLVHDRPPIHARCRDPGFGRELDERGGTSPDRHSAEVAAERADDTGQSDRPGLAVAGHAGRFQPPQTLEPQLVARARGRQLQAVDGFLCVAPKELEIGLRRIGRDDTVHRTPAAIERNSAGRVEQSGANVLLE